MSIIIKTVFQHVDLGSPHPTARAGHWQPEFLNWGRTGPRDFQVADVYLRTATSVMPRLGDLRYVRMPDYRWASFSPVAIPSAASVLGDSSTGSVAADPGEYRATLRRLIVTQGDTEPASVEQQRMLGHIAPSLYDMRNLFQVNVEEAVICGNGLSVARLLGRDGREEAEELLGAHSRRRQATHSDLQRAHSRLAQLLHVPTSPIAMAISTESLAESSFDPLAARVLSC